MSGISLTADPGSDAHYFSSFRCLRILHCRQMWGKRLPACARVVCDANGK